MTPVMSCRSRYQSIGSLKTSTAWKGASSVPQLGSAMSGIASPSGVSPACSHAISNIHVILCIAAMTSAQVAQIAANHSSFEPLHPCHEICRLTLMSQPCLALTKV